MSSYLLIKEIIENIKYCKILCDDIKILDNNTNKNYKLIKNKKNKINKINTENNKLLIKVNEIFKNEILLDKNNVLECVKIIEIANMYMKGYVKESYNILSQYDNETNYTHKMIASEIVMSIIVAFLILNGIELIKFFILIFCFTCTYIIYRNSL